MVFGGVDRGLFKGEISWYKNEEMDYYGMRLSGISYGHTQVAKKVKVKFDTKNEMSFMSENFMNRLRAEIIKTNCREGSKYSSIKAICDQKKHLTQGGMLSLSDLQANKTCNTKCILDSIFPKLTITPSNGDQLILTHTSYLLDCNLILT